MFLSLLFLFTQECNRRHSIFSTNWRTFSTSKRHENVAILMCIQTHRKKERNGGHGGKRKEEKVRRRRRKDGSRRENNKEAEIGVRFGEKFGKSRLGEASHFSTHDGPFSFFLTAMTRMRDPNAIEVGTNA